MVMTATQFYISVAVMPITTIIIVLIGVLLNNSNMNNRLNDLKETLRAEIAKSHSELLVKFAELDGRIDGLESRINAIENRLDRIEGSLGLK